MYCAECGNKVTVKCCRGLGYWYSSPPSITDAIKNQRTYKGYYLYPSLRWPLGKPFALPKLEK